MNRIKIRKLFNFNSINQSDEFDLDKVIPSEHAIWNFERMLAYNGLITTPSDRIQSKKLLVIKCLIQLFSISLALKSLYFNQIDITVKENRKWNIIFGDLSITISGLREFLLVGGSVVMFVASYVVYKF